MSSDASENQPTSLSGESDKLTIARYAQFVRETDLGKKKPDERFDIALYGLAGEIGSLGAAVKKRLLSAGRKDWDVPNDEIVEELGDSLWYCFAIGEAHGIGPVFIRVNIELLHEEIGGSSDSSGRIRGILGDRADQFRGTAPSFLDLIENGSASLEAYRQLAFLTSRTHPEQLVEVCLAVLQQLTAELMRHKLPELERELNKNLADRPIESVLGEVLWHLAALASVYSLDLSAVAQRNMAKLHRRFGRENPSPLPDKDRPENERFPRQFDVAFVSVGKGRSRMYSEGQRLGDDLTDNAYDEDGYRFHDVMHLALAAKLGWSPVLRKLMSKKRRSEQQLDEVEDGARAMIVEEAIINAIYAEGRRVAGLAVPAKAAGPVQLFTDSSDISFTFLKRLETLAVGLEVAGNNYWEWEDAILEGFAIFNRLRGAGRGTVSIDLERRSLSFSPQVLMEFSGMVAGIGVGDSGLADARDRNGFDKVEKELARTYGHAAVTARRQAVIAAVGLPATSSREIHIGGWRGNAIDVRAKGEAQAVLWEKAIVAFQAHAIDGDDGCRVTAVALSDR